MQSIYFNDESIQRDQRTLKEIGIQDGSELDFCVDEEYAYVSCNYNGKEYTSSHSKRSLVSVFSQDIFSVFCFLFLLIVEIIS